MVGHEDGRKEFRHISYETQRKIKARVIFEYYLKEKKIKDIYYDYGVVGKMKDLDIFGYLDSFAVESKCLKYEIRKIISK